MRAREIMSSPVVTVAPDTTVKEAAALLVRHRINALPVVDAAGELAGIVSEGDLIALERTPDPRRHEIPSRESARPVPTTVAEVMTRSVVATHEEADPAEIAKVMLERRVKQLPILRDGRVVGIVARRDLLRVLARPDDEIERELQDLLDGEIEMVGRFTARVGGGVVNLSGPHDRSDRHLAEVLSRGVPGVIAVRFEDEP